MRLNGLDLRCLIFLRSQYSLFISNGIQLINCDGNQSVRPRYYTILTIKNLTIGTSNGVILFYLFNLYSMTEIRYDTQVTIDNASSMH